MSLIDRLFEPDSEAGRHIQEVQRLTTAWVEATRAHGEFKKCPGLDDRNYPSQCDVCKKNYGSDFYLRDLTHTLNSYGEEVDRNESGFSFRP